MTSTTATSFADPADVGAYLHAIAEGKTEAEALAVGDNGIGYWGDNTKQGSGARCSLPRSIILGRWGTMENARGRLVRVFFNGKFIDTILSDEGPGEAEVAEGHGLDLNCDAWVAFGVSVPVEERVEWDWLIDLLGK